MIPQYDITVYDIIGVCHFFRFFWISMHEKIYINPWMLQGLEPWSAALKAVTLTTEPRPH